MPAVIAAPSPTRADWTAFEAELDRWAEAGRAATFWWRDDDAVRWTPALAALVELAGGTPMALAVVPEDAEAGLAGRLADHPEIAVLQHGWRHRNHAPPGEKKSEFGAYRPLALRRAELAAGAERLGELFGPRALPVLAPPWNRIAPDLVCVLPAIGFRGLSLLDAGAASPNVPGLRIANVHADLVDWRGQRGFIGEGPALGRLTAHLEARRTGAAGSDEVTGILTHHLVQDAAAARFLRQLLTLLRNNAAARVLAAGEIFQPAITAAAP